MSLLEAGAHKVHELVVPDVGVIVSKKVLSAEGGRVVLFAFGAGEGLSEHTTPYEAMLVLMEGRARVGVAGVEAEVAAGQIMALPAGIPHSVHALEPVRLVLIMVKA